jgi:hypothetical protein
VPSTRLPRTEKNDPMNNDPVNPVKSTFPRVAPLWLPVVSVSEYEPVVT